MPRGGKEGHGEGNDEEEDPRSMNSNQGTIVNCHTVRYERLLPGPIERVWDYISNSSEVSKWQRCAVDVSIERRIGGQFSQRICPPPMPSGQPGVTLEIPTPKEGFIESPRGLVNDCVPPKVLAYSFIEPSCDLASHVRFELEERDGQVLLTFTHSHLPPNMMAQVGAGWHVHLDTLAAILNGEEPPEFLPAFLEQFKKYSAALAVTLVLSSTASAAMADSSDTAYQVMNEQRARLLNVYDRVWKDTSDLKYKLSVLARERSQDTARAENDLQRELNHKTDQLHQVELDLHDLEKSMI
jgi:uncharacterized protein YndB with AHSA1/START domain